MSDIARYTLKEALEGFLGKENIEYCPDNTCDGEAQTYGIKGWQYVMRILHLGSNFALDLINNDRAGGRNEELLSHSCAISIGGYIFFLNQLLTRKMVEHDVLFKFSMHRYVINKIGEKISSI